MSDAPAGIQRSPALHIGGRTFNAMNLRARTFRADAAQTAIISELGLDTLDMAPQDGEPMVDYVSRLNRKITETGRVADLVAHYIMPAGVTESTWTRQTASETAAFLNGVQDEDSRRLIWELAAELVFFSLRSNVGRLLISQNSFAAEQDLTSETGSENPADAESLNSNSANGRRSFDRFPRMTGLLPEWLRPGRSARV